MIAQDVTVLGPTSPSVLSSQLAGGPAEPESGPADGGAGPGEYKAPRDPVTKNRYNENDGVAYARAAVGTDISFGHKFGSPSSVTRVSGRRPELFS